MKSYGGLMAAMLLAAAGMMPEVGPKVEVLPLRKCILPSCGKQYYGNQSACYAEHFHEWKKGKNRDELVQKATRQLAHSGE